MALEFIVREKHIEETGFTRVLVEYVDGDVSVAKAPFVFEPGISRADALDRVRDHGRTLLRRGLNIDIGDRGAVQ